MREAILLVVSVLTYVAVGDTIKPLFEASSAAEYNRWLWLHRKEYPEFLPVRALVGVERSSPGWMIPTATCLTDSGTILKRYVYPDSWDMTADIQQVTRVLVREDEGGFVVHRRGRTDGSTAYDQSGRKLFDGVAYPRFNLWFRDIWLTDTPRKDHPWWQDTNDSDSTQVLNERGEVVGMLPRVSMSTATGSGDTLMAAVTRSGTIVFDRRARIRWRDSMFGTAPRIAAISPDGRAVAVVTRDSVGMHDLVTGENRVLGFDASTTASVRVRSIALSKDGDFVAVLYRVGQRVPDSLLLRVLTRDAKAVAPPLRLESDHVDNMFWMGDTVVLVASPGVPGNGSGKGYQTGPCSALAVTLSGDMRTLTVPGRFGRLGVWYQQGRSLAYVDKDMGYFAVFRVPAK